NRRNAFDFAPLDLRRPIPDARPLSGAGLIEEPDRCCQSDQHHAQNDLLVMVFKSVHHLPSFPPAGGFTTSTRTRTLSSRSFKTLVKVPATGTSGRPFGRGLTIRFVRFGWRAGLIGPGATGGGWAGAAGGGGAGPLSLGSIMSAFTSSPCGDL